MCTLHLYRKIFAGALAFLVGLSTNAVAEGSPRIEAFSFVAYGDMPYMAKLPDGRTDEQILNQDIAPKIRNNRDLPFVIHLGDLGRSQNACSDSWLEKTRDFWKNDLVKPVFYTPGDNEWTDCDRKNLIEPKSELARLEAIRRIFFSQPMPIGSAWRYEQQSTLLENQMWWHKGVRFVTLHVVNKDNGRAEILLDDPQRATQLVDERDHANQIWLERAFDLAKGQETYAVVVAAQVDPFGKEDGVADALTRCLSKPAYANFCSRLQSLAAELDKPVLFIHGDTNAYCLDQPFAKNAAPRLWRLNAPGDYKMIDAAVVSFDPTDGDLPFKVTGILSGVPAPKVCDYTR